MLIGKPAGLLSPEMMNQMDQRLGDSPIVDQSDIMIAGPVMGGLAKGGLAIDNALTRKMYQEKIAQAMAGATEEGATKILAHNIAKDVVKNRHALHKGDLGRSLDEIPKIMATNQAKVAEYGQGLIQAADKANHLDRGLAGVTSIGAGVNR